MEKTVEQVGKADGFPSPMNFEDVNGDGVFELTGDDWAFYSWYASPRIILRNHNGEFRVAPELMRRPAPTPAELSVKATELRKAKVYAGSPVAPEVSRYMLDLIYSGNGESAWSFLDRVWPKQQSGKAEFIQNFKDQLATSRFWPEIRNLNKNLPLSTDH